VTGDRVWQSGSGGSSFERRAINFSRATDIERAMVCGSIIAAYHPRTRGDNPFLATSLLQVELVQRNVPMRVENLESALLLFQEASLDRDRDAS